MTANNRVSRWVSRWLMRIQAAGSVLRIVYFGGILVTTGVSALNQFGHGRWAWPFVACVFLGTLTFAYIYAERGLFNQQNRDRNDVGSNFAGPTMYMDDAIIGAAVFAAREGRPPSEDEREAIEQAVAQQWHEYREGIDVDGVGDRVRARDVVPDGGEE